MGDLKNDISTVLSAQGIDTSGLIVDNLVALFKTKLSKTEEQITELQKDSDFLNCLKNMGVDNWPGYSEAFKMLEEDDEA